MTITGPDARTGAPGQAMVDAAMLVLERMGLTPADLLATPAARQAAPTFAEYIPGRVGSGQRRLPTGIRLVLEPGDRPVGQPPYRRAHAVGDPAARPARPGQRRGPAEFPRRA